MNNNISGAVSSGTKDGARHSPSRFFTLSDPSKVVYVVRQLQYTYGDSLVRFFITLTFRRDHFVQNNKFKGVKKVVKFLIEDMKCDFILIRRENTKKGTHFHLACNKYCTVKQVRAHWAHGYVHIGPVRKQQAVINYMFKGLSCNTNELSLVTSHDYTKNCIV